jgi:hypothetical protein
MWTPDMPKRVRDALSWLIGIAISVPLVILTGTGTPQVQHVAFGVVTVLLLGACFGSTLRTDPVAFLSIAVGPLLINIAAALSPETIWTTAQLEAFGWLALFLFGGARIWPWWQREVLRRFRRGSAEREVLDAERRIRRLAFGPDSSPDTWAALHEEISGLYRWMTPRTKSTIVALASIPPTLVDGTRPEWNGSLGA